MFNDETVTADPKKVNDFLHAISCHAGEGVSNEIINYLLPAAFSALVQSDFYNNELGTEEREKYTDLYVLLCRILRKTSEFTEMHPHTVTVENARTYKLAVS